MINRRGFFGTVAGLLAWRPGATPKAGMKIGATITIRKPPRFTGNPSLLTPGMMAEETLKALQQNLCVARAMSLNFQEQQRNDLQFLDGDKWFGPSPSVPKFIEPAGDIPLVLAGEDEDYDEWDD